MPASEAMPGGAPDGPMPLIESAILDVHSIGRAGMQGGDSGGPFFVDGKLAGLATAGTANGDPDLPSPSAAITTLAGTKDWIEGVVSGRDKAAILTAATTPEPPKTPQTSADRAGIYAGVAAIGLIAAGVLSRLMASLLYGVNPIDLPTFGGVALALTAVAMFASWLPAHRAASVDPAVTLREE